MKKYAFTLAEVLITLSVIGIVSALTIPSFINKYNQFVTVNKVKQANSLLNSAFLMAKTENGDYLDFLDTQLNNGVDGSTATIQYLSNSLKIVKDCGTTTKDCRPRNYYHCKDKSWTDYRTGGDYCVILNNGMMFCVNNEKQPTAKCDLWGSCARFHIDINGGLKGPNQYSRDDFWWIYSPDGKIKPYGTNVNGEICKAQDQSRSGAVYWILKNNNMNYLKQHN